MPYIRSIPRSDTSCLSYFVCCPGSGVAAVVDPSQEVDQYMSAAAAEGCRITHVIDTHIHADHVSGARTLAARLAGGAELVMPAGAEVSFRFRPVDEGSEIGVGAATLKAIRTPGHTKESMSFLYIDEKRASEPWGVFTGDSLFVGDVGRLDLDGHGTLREAHQSLVRLKSLPDYVEVYPAHYAGSDCASNRNLSFKASSTIGFERRHNRMLQWGDYGEFEKAMSVDPVKSPPMWREIKMYNKGLLEAVGGLQWGH